MKFTSTLSSTEKDQLLQLWNREYPQSLSYLSMAEFEDYLNKLEDLHHLLLSEGNHIIGWYFDFIREGERWFGMIIHSDWHGQGLGSQLLEAVKKQRDELNGWVIDHQKAFRSDGQAYRSPLPFYIKQGFEVLEDVRLESDKISAVKVKWQQSI